MTSPRRHRDPSRCDASRRRSLVVGLASCLAIVLAVLAIGLVDSASAGPDDDADTTPELGADEQPGDGDDDARRRELREKVEEKMREARRNFMDEQVGLDAETSDALEALLDAHHRDLFDAHNEVRRTRRALATAIEDDDTDDETFARLEREHLDAVRALETQRLTIFEQTRELLSPEQQARLLIALPAFERKVKRHIRRARGEGKRGGRGGRRRGRDRRFAPPR